MALRLRQLHWSLGLALVLAAGGCKKPYRIGDEVLVERKSADGKVDLYPAFIKEKKGKTKYRVHYQGWDSRFEEDVGIERIKGRVVGPLTPPPPPEDVRAAASAARPAGSANAAPPAPYKVGDRVRVSWRGTKYPATIVGIVASDRVLVHYDGHESAWDETVTLEGDRVEPLRR